MSRFRHLLDRVPKLPGHPSAPEAIATSAPEALPQQALPTAGRPWASPRLWFTAGLPVVLLLVVATTLLLQPGAASSRNGAGPSSGDGIAARSDSEAGSGDLVGSPSPDTTWGPIQPAETQGAPTPTPAPTPDLSGYVWPLRNARVTLPFVPTRWGEVVVNGKLFHDGLDMATACGDKVMAAHDGVVLAAGRHFDDFLGWQGDLTAYYDRLDKRHSWGYLPIIIVIDDGNGLRSIYAHESRVLVKVGQQVKAGQVIGIEGQTGHATGCHLHFGLFNPSETATFKLDPTVAKRLLLPSTETARINPLLVLPYRNEVTEMRTLRPQDAAAWRASHASPGPSASAMPTASATPTPAPTPTPTPVLEPILD